MLKILDCTALDIAKIAKIKYTDDKSKREGYEKIIKLLESKMN